ncbi:MAG TPA: agmatinase [Vicinamibacterales bacterium]|nr:agmatinase [Vicinamibacterales bacterium]
MTTVTLIGAPWDGSSSFQRGAAAAPARIRQALWSPSSNSCNERGDDLAADGVLQDEGDIPVGDDASSAREAIEGVVHGLLGRGARPLVLGGDHSITYPILRAYGARGAGPAIVHFDAHGDLYDSFEGDRYSHACPFARVMEEGLASRLIQIGVRTLTAHQRDQVAKFDVQVFGPARRREALPVVAALDGPIYVSLDLDVLEPMLAPGLSHPEPGGLTVLDVLDVLNTIQARVVGADIVEYNPLNDVRDLTARVAAKFVKELVGLLRSPRGGGW